VSAFTVPARGGAGMTITVTDTTTNQGGSPVGPTTTKIYWSSNVTYDAGDTFLGARGVPGLAGGGSNSGSTNVTIPPGAATGTLYILAVADADNAAVETQEANNTLARTILIGPDLWVTTVTAPAKGAAGSAIVVTETTANQGGGDAAASVTKFYLSADGSIGPGDMLLDGSRTVPVLAPGGSSTASTTVTIPSNAPVGTLWLIAQADAESTVPETLETNQTRARSISIGPDLVVSTMTVGASTVAAGGVVSVTDTVMNQGADAAAPSVTRFYLSKNLLLDAGDIPIAATRSVPQIAANGSSTGTTSVTIPLSAPPDSYFLLAVADGNNVVGESLETNNATARPIQVTPAP